MPKRRSSSLEVTLTEGSIRVRSGERLLTILGGPCASAGQGESGADFVVELDEILCWDAPHEAVEIDVTQLLEIVKAIEAEFERLGLSVEFD